MVNTMRSKNKDWNVGSTVKVGFMTLKVVGVRAEKDYMPDIYTLDSLDGTKHYEFIPHHGLNRIDGDINMETKQAVYIGHQKINDNESFPLFNVEWAGNALNGSTVNVKTIVRLGIHNLVDKLGNRLYSVPSPKGGK